MVCKDAFDEEDIHLLESLVKKYLLLIEEHSPQLKNKVKTHLLTHLTDEISRHGPPLGYSEDVFEKRHGVIRAKLFNQENQLARSRDTAILFGKSYLFLHVLMGGFFQTNDATWTQSTGRVQELAQRKEMKDFIGHLSFKDHNSDSLKEGRTTIRVEQEDKDIYKRFIVHNMNHAVGVYVVNVYSLKCPSGIPFSDLKTCSKKL